jgi:hypothetical protein
VEEAALTGLGLEGSVMLKANLYSQESWKTSGPSHWHLDSQDSVHFYGIRPLVTKFVLQLHVF